MQNDYFFKVNLNNRCAVNEILKKRVAEFRADDLKIFYSNLDNNSQLLQDSKIKGESEGGKDSCIMIIE